VTTHQLEIKLRDVKPQVWRRVVVPSSWKLAKVSRVIEAAMGWGGYHLHAFEVGDRRYGQPDPDWDLGLEDERKVALAGVLTEVKAKMRWDYDFGDGWEHDVVVEAIGESNASLRAALCLDGANACPPDDSGGPWGYENLLDALADPAHPDHDDMREWIGEGFDPKAFDLVAVNAALQHIR
jgi:Plasmid pRiA4b ORF-3-like protein